MGLRDRFDAAADTVASVVSSVFVTAPDHPSRGGVAGDSQPRDAGENGDRRESGAESAGRPDRPDGTPADRHGDGAADAADRRD
jgi:hypothetical protein